jgi:hypothetical protein
MKKFVCVLTLTFAFVGFAVADFTGFLTSADGGKYKAKKIEGKGKDAKVGDEMAVKLAKDFKGVYKGKIMFDKDTKKATFEPDGDKLSDDAVKTAVKDAGDKGANARFITNKDDEVTEILLIQKKKAGGQ